MLILDSLQGEGFSTMVARKWFNLCVNMHVPFEVVVREVALSTLPTEVAPLVSVPAEVSFVVL